MKEKRVRLGELQLTDEAAKSAAPVFRPRAYKKMQITVRLDEKRIMEIDELAARFSLSRSELVNQCVDFALDSFEHGILEIKEGTEE